MNCTEFDTIVVDMARGLPLDSGQRAIADAHARVCASCRARLAEERDITDHLSALRAASREVSAPAALEATLVAAFRAQTASRVPAAPPAPGPWVTRPAAPWWIAAAAALALVAGGALAGNWRAGSPADAGASGNPTATAAAPVETVDESPRQASGIEARPEAPATDAVAKAVADVNAAAEPARPARRRRAAAQRGEGAGPAPLVYASLPAALPRWSDAPMVPVRLQLPYAALPALGLQVTKEHWGESVPVEVLVGEDGLARGIRVIDDESFRE